LREGVSDLYGAPVLNGDENLGRFAQAAVVENVGAVSGEDCFSDQGLIALVALADSLLRSWAHLKDCALNHGLPHGPRTLRAAAFTASRLLASALLAAQ